MVARAGQRPRLNVGIAAAIFGGFIHVDAALAEANRFEGRSVASVLDGLQDASLKFLFSSDLVPDSLRVTVEPGRRDRLGLAREVLAAHGLAIRSVSPSLYIVIRAVDDRQHEVSGEVVDEQSGAPVRGARVELYPLGRVTWSDGAGRFAFADIAGAGNYRLLASIEDHSRGETPLRIDHAGQVAHGTIRLRPMELDTVVVEASRYELASDTGTGAQRLDGAQLARQPDIADDPIRALRQLPGVVQGGITAASNLRGGEVNEVLVLLDGFVLRQVYHLPGYQSPFSLLDEGGVGSVDVFTGGFPARYGNRLGGVFDISSRRADEPPASSVGVSFVNAHARASGSSHEQRTSWSGSVRLGTLRPVLQSLSVDTGRPSYGDISLAVTHRPAPDLALQARFLGASDEYRVQDDDEQAEVSSRTRYAWLRADFEPRDTISASMLLGLTRIDSDRVGSVDKPEFAVSEVIDHLDAQYRDLRGNLNWQWSERSRLNAGFEWTQGDADHAYDASVEFAEPLAELFSRDSGFERHLQVGQKQRRVALFASQRWKLHDGWMPEVGLRMQDFEVDGSRHERTWDPRVGLRWEMQPRTALRAHWGRFHQADEVHELQVADGVTELPGAQRSEHLILGLEHSFLNGTQLRLEGFRKRQDQPRARFENLMSPLEVFAEVAPDRVRVAPDSADIRGVEISVALERESWSAWSSLSAARAVDVFAGDEVPRSWDQRFAWGGGIDWHRGQWRIGAAAALRDGWPTTPVNFDDAGEATLGARNSRRLARFATLDLRIEYRRPIAVGSLALALEISNLTNRRNECCSDVEVEDIGTEDETIEVETQYWPRLLPSLSINWEH